MRENDDQSSISLAKTSGESRAGIALPENDPLSMVLETIRLRGAVFFLWEPSWPFATGVPNGATFRHLVAPGSDQIISYHIVTQGPCWACVDGEAPIQLDSGDILILPHGDAYVIGSEPRSPRPEDTTSALEFFQLMAEGKLPSVIVDGGDGPEKNRLICGFLGCAMQPYNPLLGTLPK